MTLPLPPTDIRMNSPKQRDDENYRSAGRRVAQAVHDLLDLEQYSNKAGRLDDWGALTVLDHGCGTARLLDGLDMLDRRPERYIGLDVQEHLVEWCRSALGRLGPFDFDLVDMHNRRYSPAGSLQPVRVVPDGYDDVDLVVSRSVFTHMTAADIHLCLREFRRVIADDGRAYVTVNVANGVPSWRDNPGQPDAPPLLRTELNKTYFEHMVEDCGFRASVFVESIENQCVYLLRPA